MTTALATTNTTATRTLGQRTAVRTIVLAACLVLLALSTAPRAGAEVNNGGNLGEAAAAQAAACRAMGGTPVVTWGGGVFDEVMITCVGGVAGGWKCENFDTTSYCYDPRPLLVNDDPGPTDGGPLGSEQTMTPIWFSDDAQPTTPLLFLAGSAAPIAAPATDAVADPVREPILEPVAASPATDAVNDAIGACFASGGDPEVTIEDDHGFRSVDCVYEDHQEYCYYYDDGSTSCGVIYSLTPPAGGLPLDGVGEISDGGAAAPSDPTLPGVGGAAPAEPVAAAPTAPSLDKAAFKAGCEQGGGSYIENLDGSFQCNLRGGGTIKCPNTTSPCTSTPAPDQQPGDNRNPVGDIGDGGVVAPSDPTPPVADPVTNPVTNPIIDPVLEPVVAPVVEPVVTPIVEPVVEPILAPVAELAPADPQGLVTIEDEQP